MIFVGDWSILAFQVFKVVVDWLISSDTRAVHKILSTNADLSFRMRLRNAFVEHILSKIYWTVGCINIQTSSRADTRRMRIINLKALVFSTSAQVTLYKHAWLTYTTIHYIHTAVNPSQTMLLQELPKATQPSTLLDLQFLLKLQTCTLPGISLTNKCRGVGILLLFRAVRPSFSESIANAVSLYEMVCCHNITKHSKQ